MVQNICQDDSLTCPLFSLVFTHGKLADKYYRGELRFSAIVFLDLLAAMSS